MKGRLHPSIPLTIEHVDSQQSLGIQAVDLFSWGIYRKYEHNDTKWYDYFKMVKGGHILSTLRGLIAA